MCAYVDVCVLLRQELVFHVRVGDERHDNVRDCALAPCENVRAHGSQLNVATCPEPSMRRQLAKAL